MQHSVVRQSLTVSVTAMHVLLCFTASPIQVPHPH